MRDIVRQLLERLEAGKPLAYCRLVETRGSTPQKPGAAMLVFPDGSQFGTLGGGCVEAEVKRRALATLAEGAAQIATFQLDSDYGWDDGLICGGRMQVLIDPLRSLAEADYFRAMQTLLDAGRGIMEVAAFDADKSELPAGALLLLDEQSRVVARRNIDTAMSLPATVLENAPDVRRRPRPMAVSGVAYLPTLDRCRLLIVGAGHIGQAVAEWAPDLDFDVWVVDDRAEYASRERFPRALRLICGPIGETLRDLEISPDTYCLIVTRGHNHDEEALYHLAQRGARYVGMIGSKRKIKLIFDDLEAEGVPVEALAKVYAPLGMPIGSQTVPEIAVSILAELIAHRNLGEVPGRVASVLATDTP